MTVLKYGELAGREVSKRIAAPVASLAALKLLAAKDLANGQEIVVTATGKRYTYNDSSVVTADDQLLVAPASGVGNWLLAPGYQSLLLPIDFTLADAAVLYTIPTGALLIPEEFTWKITADWTGGTNSAIGVSSTKTGFTTRGDLLGGASGDVLATLVASGVNIAGTAGAKWDTIAHKRALWKAADVLARFDRITSVFTAGTGFVRVSIKLDENAGA